MSEKSRAVIFSIHSKLINSSLELHRTQSYQMAIAGCF